MAANQWIRDSMVTPTQPRWQRTELARAFQCAGAATKAVVDLRLRRRAIVSDDHGNPRRSMAHPITDPNTPNRARTLHQRRMHCIRFAGDSTCRRSRPVAGTTVTSISKALRTTSRKISCSSARACLVVGPTICSAASWESRTGGCGTRRGIPPNLVGGVVGLAVMGPSRLAPCRALHPARSHSGA